MMPLRLVYAALLALTLAACVTTKSSSTSPPPRDLPTRGFPTTPDVRESVYLPVDRTIAPPANYGLYTVLLTRVAEGNAARVLSELFTTTGSAEEAVIARQNLNLITIPVRDAAETARALVSARNQPDSTAATVMQKFYDFDQAALLMASVCRPDRGAAVMKVCGSGAPDGPLLVTTQLALDGSVAPGQRLLIVNLSTTRTEAIREVLAVYRRQIVRTDAGFSEPGELDGWRLRLLNHVLDAAHMLPGLSKAYAGSK
jgi:hypothetical protein